MVSDKVEAPELRLILLPSAAVVQVRHPGESEFGKVTQKLLKELSPSAPHYGQTRPVLSAGSSLVLRAVSDTYGGVRSTEIEAMSDSLAKCLAQLASSEDLFHAHVCSPEGERLEFIQEALRWELSQPMGKSGDYALKLVNDHGITPPPPISILPGSPLRYVTSELVYGANEVLLYIDDADRDGLADAWELRHFGNLASTATDDPDGDGQSNAVEFATGTLPLSGSSLFAATASNSGAGTLTLGWPSVPGKIYRIESGPAPGGPWSPLTTVPAADFPSATTSRTIDLTPSFPMRFYRIALDP